MAGLRATHGNCSVPISTVKNENDNGLTSDDEAIVARFQCRIDAIKEGHRQTFNPDHESPPKLPAFHPSFALVEDLCAALFVKAASILEASDYRDTNTQRLLRMITDLQNIDYPEDKRVALRGSIGVGKSSLINALLNTQELCANGASGESCTMVITEFTKASDTQKTPYKAEVYFYDTREIDTMLKEHLAHWYQFFTKNSESLGGDESEDIEAAASTALEVFKALFIDREECRNEGAIRNLLNRATSAADKNTLAKFSEWTRDMVSRKDAESGLISVNANTSLDLQQKLEPFLQRSTNCDDEETPSPSYWPLVKLVRVGLNSPLLNRGLVLADLPGMTEVQLGDGDHTYNPLNRSI